MVSAPLRIDPDDATPPYEQICRQIAAGSNDGSLAVGTKLPTVRGLAEQLGVAPGTVAKAYTRLEQSGLIETRGRAGTFVSSSGDRSQAEAAAAAADFAQRTRHLALNEESLISVVRAAVTNVRSR
ncbi:GntR family transcriptional regulator [Allobranchiibius sp. GilTou38]|nr:GntR family transcriptional regulator [Allobranchiibius sp. GilTou38]